MRCITGFVEKVIAESVSLLRFRNARAWCFGDSPRMRLACVSICLLVACGGSRHSAPDGAVGDGAADASSDAGVDAPPDATPCVTPDDRDGDGVCDSNDVCPDVPDPGQADLDGDHVGWMCDPVESITLDGQGLPAFVQASIHEDTFAARTQFQCSGPPTCGHALVQVGPAGVVIARSDSLAAADAWQATATTSWLDGPLVTPDDRVLWSRGYGSGDTGDFDLATRTFTTRANGVFKDDDVYRSADVYSGSSLEAVALSTTSDFLTQNLVEVGSGAALTTVATAQGFTGETSAFALAIPGTNRALVPVRTNYADGVKVYTRGASGLADVMAGGLPLTGLAELEALPVDGATQGYCAQRGSSVYAVGWDAGGNVTTYALPISSCLNVAATDRAGVRIFSQGTGAGRVVGYVYGGTLHNLTTADSAFYANDTLPLLITTFTGVWEIAADGTWSQLISNVDTPLAAMSGDTINILAHHAYPNGNGYGDWILTRIKSGQAPQSVTLVTNEVNGIDARLATSVEGAALVDWNDQPVIVPSQSMTPVLSPFARMSGGIRDGHTVVFAQHVDGTGAPYEYTEVNGSPQFTLLDASGTGPDGWVLDIGPTHHATSWFVYSNTSAGCKIARFTASGLDSVGCATYASAVRMLGTRADGVMVATDGTSIYLFTASGAQRLGPSTSSTYDYAILDTSVQPPVLVGWNGSSSSQELVCLATHPDRCWLVPSPMFTSVVETVASATAHGGDGSIQLVLATQLATMQVTLTILRTIGPGTVTP